MANSRANLWRTLIFVGFIGPGPVIGIVPWWLTGWHVGSPIAGWRFIGLALIALGVYPLADSIARFVREGHGTPAPLYPTDTLIVTGLYRYVRNPMYVGVLLMIFGQAVFFASRALALYGACGALCVHLFVIFYEEPTLRRRYGELYEAYRRRVGRWIPGLTRLK